MTTEEQKERPIKAHVNAMDAALPSDALMISSKQWEKQKSERIEISCSGVRQRKCKVLLIRVEKMIKKLKSGQYNLKAGKSGSKQITQERMQNLLKMMLLNTGMLESSAMKTSANDKRAV